jgi:hypothetical protein
LINNPPQYCYAKKRDHQTQRSLKETVAISTASAKSPHCTWHHTGKISREDRYQYAVDRHIETGREVPNLAMLQKIARALGVKVKELIPY